MIEDFWNELSEGEIHARDQLQFELKSEFFINPQTDQNFYKQEFFIFIPNSLQINAETYSKQQFYLDQTNLIRYKTPLISFSNLMDLDYLHSPLIRLKNLFHAKKANLSAETISDELKLFAVIFRAALRERVHQLLKSFIEAPSQQTTEIFSSIALLCTEINQVTQIFRQLQATAHARSASSQILRHFKYVDEIISMTIDQFFVLLLKQMQASEHFPPDLEKQLIDLILKENAYRNQQKMGPKISPHHHFAIESVLHRQGLLNQFALEALMLNNYRSSLEEKHGNILGALAAGVAMCVYMTLFVWKISTLVINSFPFVALAVFLYILKDRIKEGFKTLYFKQAYRWFPDYSTEIRSPQGEKIGKLEENFIFIDSTQLSPEFLEIRNHHFHEELQALQRHETIIQYKREISLQTPRSGKNRRRELTIIFRLNIHRFLQKASDALQPHLSLNSDSKKVLIRQLPKVYHLNLIIRNSYQQADLTPKVEIKAFRVVIDKTGIKRVEHIPLTTAKKLN